MPPMTLRIGMNNCVASYAVFNNIKNADGRAEVRGKITIPVLDSFRTDMHVRKPSRGVKQKDGSMGLELRREVRARSELITHQ